MKVEPAHELRLFIDVRIKSRDSLPNGADAVKDLQGEVSCRRRPGDLSLGLDPGKIPMRPGAADLFVGISVPSPAACRPYRFSDTLPASAEPGKTRPSAPGIFTNGG